MTPAQDLADLRVRAAADAIVRTRLGPAVNAPWADLDDYRAAMKGNDHAVCQVVADATEAVAIYDAIQAVERKERSRRLVNQEKAA